MDPGIDGGAAVFRTREPTPGIPPRPRAAEAKSVLDEPITAAPRPPRPRRPAPSRNDAVFRFAAAWFAVWVVFSALTSPVSKLRPSWWPIFLGVGVCIALSMLIGACMTVGDYLRHRRR